MYVSYPHTKKNEYKANEGDDWVVGTELDAQRLTIYWGLIYLGYYFR